MNDLVSDRPRGNARGDWLDPKKRHHLRNSVNYSINIFTICANQLVR